MSQNTQADAPPPRVSFRDVSVRIARSRHALDRRARNEVLNNLLEFSNLMFRSTGHPSQSVTTLLNSVSIDLDGGRVVGVLSTQPASARTLTEVLAGMTPIDEGEILHRGSVASFGQISAVLTPYESCRFNLNTLGRFLGVSHKSLREAITRVESVCEDFAVIDLPLRRVPRWAFTDMAIVMICELGFDTLAAPEFMLPTSDVVAEYWLEYVSGAESRDQLIALTSRRPDVILPHISQILLLDGPEVSVFDTREAVQTEHAALLDRALTAKPEPKDVALPSLAEDDDDEDEDEDGTLDTFRDDEGSRLPPEQKSPQQHGKKDVFERFTIAGHAYANRESPNCMIKLGGSEGTQLLRADLSPAISAKDLCGMPEAVRPLPAVFREDGAVVRLVFETLKPNLWVLPGIDLVQRKTPLLRSFAPNEQFVPEPTLLSLDIEIPPDFITHSLYWLSAFVCITDADRQLDDIAISKSFLAFLNLSHSGQVRAGAECDEGDFPIFFKQNVGASCQTLPTAEAYFLISVELRDHKGEPLTPEDGGYICASGGHGFEIVTTVLATEEVRDLQVLADFWRENQVLLRVESHPTSIGPGSHQLRLRIAPNLLGSDIYRLCVCLDLNERLADPHWNPVRSHETAILVTPAQRSHDPMIARWRDFSRVVDGPFKWARKTVGTKVPSRE